MVTVADNLQTLVDSTKAIKQVIIDKGGNIEGDITTWADAISKISGGSAWTGHADSEGLKAIGWTDEDIKFYQEHGVCWNEEDDDVHRVSDDNKALYGVLTANNISTYSSRIVYLPKIDTRGKTLFANFLQNCKSLIAIPMLDTSAATNVSKMFFGCSALVCVPCLDLSKATTLEAMFQACSSLAYIPKFNTVSVKSFKNTFYGCGSLQTIPQMDFSSVTSMDGMFYYAQGLKGLPELDTHNVTTLYQSFYNCVSLSYLKLDVASVVNTNSVLGNVAIVRDMYLKNLYFSWSLSSYALLSKESLIYTINHEAATEPITITLASSAYTRLAEDADVVEALANHPNVSLAK